MQVEVHAGSKTVLADFIEVLEAIRDTKQMNFIDGHVHFEEIGE